ncbi:MAG: pitrilysin family protein [Oligoflexia bacterium]|nr:pitrilysin family protein [Oligoflexia bacterium]
MKKLMIKTMVLKALTLAAFALAVSPMLARPLQAVEVSFEEDKRLPLVYVNLAVKAGAVTDPEGESGITNFVGEMLLRGTRDKTKKEIDLELDQMGARLEVETREEALILRGAVLSSQLEPFLKLVLEIVTEPSFPEKEIGKLRKEIVSGLLEELGDDSSLEARHFSKFLFRDHPYGNPVLGKIGTIERLDRAKVLAQYENIFHEKNFLIVGEGDAAEKTIQAWGDSIGKLRPSGDRKAAAVVGTPENAPERRLEIVDKPDRTQTQIDVGQIGVRMTDPDYFALYVGNHAFGGGSFSARLMTEIRVKRGWSYGAYSYFRPGLKPRSWIAHLFPAAKDAPAALAETLHLIEQLKKDGITSPEFEFAQRSLVNSAGFMYNTPQKRVANTLLERTTDLPSGFMESYASRISALNREQVNAALKRFLHPEKLAMSVLGTASQLKEALTKASGVKAPDVVVVPYTEE